MKSAAAFAIMAAGLCSGCSTSDNQTTAGSESHFLSICDDSCPSGLSCQCGTCTTVCSQANECTRLHPAAVCVAAPSGTVGASCQKAQPSPHCDVPCSASSDCASFGAAFFCDRGYCRTDPLSQPNEPLPGFGLLCEQSTVVCETAKSPPQIVGSYAGQATVVLTSNALWDASEVDTFTATISDQRNDSIVAELVLPSLTLDVPSAVIRGQGAQFTIYTSTFVDQDECNLEARTVLSGTLDSSTSPATIQGGLVLRFTGNYSGEACTAKQIDSYPDTGANFQFSASKTP